MGPIWQSRWKRQEPRRVRQKLEAWWVEERMILPVDRRSIQQLDPDRRLDRESIRVNLSSPCCAHPERHRHTHLVCSNPQPLTVAPTCLMAAATNGISNAIMTEHEENRDAQKLSE